jgi:hypothetical protein
MNFLNGDPLTYDPMTHCQLWVNHRLMTLLFFWAHISNRKNYFAIAQRPNNFFSINDIRYEAGAHSVLTVNYRLRRCFSSGPPVSTGNAISLTDKDQKALIGTSIGNHAWFMNAAANHNACFFCIRIITTIKTVKTNNGSNRHAHVINLRGLKALR